LAHLGTRCFAQGRRMQHKVQQAQGVGRSRPGDALHKVGAFSTKCNAFGTRPTRNDQGQQSSWLSADYGWVGEADERLPRSWTILCIPSLRVRRIYRWSPTTRNSERSRVTGCGSLGSSVAAVYMKEYSSNQSSWLIIRSVH